MHIVYVSREYPPAKRGGGIASYLREVAEAFVAHGHRVTVVAASDDTRREYEETLNGVRVLRLRGGDFIVPSIEPTALGLRKLRMLYRFFPYRRRLRKVVRQLTDVDVIEVAEFGAEAYYLHDIGIPITMRLHTPALLDRETSQKRKFSLGWAHEYWVGKRELQLIPKMKAITSCSQSLLDWTRRFVEGVTQKSEVIYNPIDISSWKRNEVNRYEENTILFVGTVAQEKGVGDLVEAAKLLRSEGVEVKLTIAGKLGSYGEALMAECECEGLSWCKFTGHITREELKPLYASHKVACFPSWYEALGMVCLEAMTIGNVVVGSSNGGMSEVITDGVDGYLVEPKSPRLLADRLREALAMPVGDVNRMRSAAFEAIKTKFSTDCIINQLEQHYKSIIRQ